MKRWILTIEKFHTKPLIYAETTEIAKQVFSSENVIDVQQYTDMSYLKTIQKLKNKSDLLEIRTTPKNSTMECYKCEFQDGILSFRLYKDNADDLYYDFVEYTFMSNDSLVYPITFTFSNPKDFYDLFFAPSPYCEVFSYRLYGQPKLTKPVELKGMKQSFSVNYIPNKCKCQCFVNGNDLWIKHRDFFSQHHKPAQQDIGTPLTYRLGKYFNMDKKYLDKFVYPDSWGEIILRNEAWIVFRNFNQLINKNKYYPIKSMIKMFLQSDFCIQHLISQCDLGGGDWERFFERVCRAYIEYVGKQKTK